MQVKLDKLNENDITIMLLQLKQQVQTVKSYEEVEKAEIAYLKQYKPIPEIEPRSYLSQEQATEEQVQAVAQLEMKLEGLSTETFDSQQGYEEPEGFILPSDDEEEEYDEWAEVETEDEVQSTEFTERPSIDYFQQYITHQQSEVLQPNGVQEADNLTADEPEEYDLTEEDDEEEYDLTEEEEEEEEYDLTEEEEEEEEEEYDLTEEEEEEEYDLTEEEEEEEYDLTEEEEEYDLTEEDEEEEYDLTEEDEEDEEEETRTSTLGNQPSTVKHVEAPQGVRTTAPNVTTTYPKAYEEVSDFSEFTKPVPTQVPKNNYTTTVTQDFNHLNSNPLGDYSGQKLPENRHGKQQGTNQQTKLHTAGVPLEKHGSHPSLTDKDISPNRNTQIPKPPVSSAQSKKPIDRLKYDYKHNPTSVPRDAKSIVSKYKGIKFFELADTFIPRKDLQRAIDRGDIIRKNDRLW